MDRLAIVVPCYNEEEVLPLASEALRGVLDDLVQKGKIAADSFILFVNDGSRDRTWELIEELWNGRPIRLLGIRTSKLTDEREPEQISLFDVEFQEDSEKRAKKKKINDALKKVRDKYGDGIVKWGMN